MSRRPPDPSDVVARRLRRGRAERIQDSLRRRSGAFWQHTDGLRRSVVLGVGLVAAGVLVHRVEAVLLAAPLLLSGIAALTARTGGAPSVVVRPLPRVVESGEPAGVLVDVDPGRGAELLALRLPRPGEDGVGPVHLLPARPGTWRAEVRRDTWGESVELRADHLVAGPDALLVHGPVTGAEARRVVLPPVLALPAGPLPPRAAGLVGAHRSRRPGDGTELRDIRPFQPGDRLRRVDWRVSLRRGGLHTGELHVREHHAEADADVVLALDTRVDVEREVGRWRTGATGALVRPGGSLDTAVRAAAALAAGYLRQGDRVGLVDLGQPQLGVRPGAGRRHLLRLRHRLVLCARSAGWVGRPVLRAEQVPHGAVVVVLSPFLDDAVVEVTVQAARRGNLVLAVDVLPADLRPDRETRWDAVALRLLELEHTTRLDALRGHGVPVLTWAGDGAGLHAVTTVLHRAARGGVRR